jgi:hypothetical protein
MNALFHSAPMPLASWGWVSLVGLFAFFVVGFEKWLRHRRAGSWQGPAVARRA